MALEGRIAIVTGASSGIGRGIADRLAASGATIVNADVRREPKQGEHYQTDVTEPTDALVTDRYGVDASYVETDTSDEADVEELVEWTVENYGGIDVLVNNAGILIPGSSQEIGVEDWDAVVDVNLRGYFLTAKAAIPHLVESDQGRIINISSVTAEFGGAGPPYSASKAGVVNLTRDLAQEVADAGVTVNTIMPGVIKTPMQDLNDEETMQEQADQTPLPRLGTPADVGNAARFFASEEAEWVTGARLLVDGGFMSDLY